MISVDLPVHWLGPFFMTLARVGGLMVFAPFLGSGALAPMMRVAFSVAFSFAVFPVVESRLPEFPNQLLPLVLALAGELAIGLVLGLVGEIFLGALQLAGQIMGFQMGFGLINIIDPQTQVESSALSLFQGLIGTLLFLSINGHHWFILAITESYNLVVAPSASSTLARELIRVSGEMFVLGFKLAAPILIILMVVDIILGVIGRAAPQIHVLIVGMPAKNLIGFVFLMVTMHSFIPYLARHLSVVHQEIYTFLGVLGR